MEMEILRCFYLFKEAKQTVDILLMLTVSQVTKAFGGRILFTKANLQVNRGDRIGLIGANGAGKSTLFSLILGENEPDEGIISLQHNIMIGSLPQENMPLGNETVLELVLSQESENYSLEAKAKRILSALAFRETDFERPINVLSGGWIMRAHLARLLIQEPDLLLLDEPTNHLDLESLCWFQNYLREYPGAILTISHDRAFLNVLCDGIVEISRQDFHRYSGNYENYLLQRRAREEQYLAAYKNQQREIAHLEKFIDRFRAKATKAAQAQARIKYLKKIERLTPPEQAEATVKFYFPQLQRSGQKVIVLENVRQAYDTHIVYNALNLIVEREQRTVLVGPNGAGKSTLLKILGGLLPLLAGKRTVGHNVSLGYFAQHRSETLNPKNTVLQEVTSLPHYISEKVARTVLGSFLFRGQDVFKNVGVLSGGEKSRLSLVKLLLDPPNFLLLDEPTTHLDMPSIDTLVKALQQYKGTVVFVSHDVHFIRSLATTVLHVQAGRLTPYAGDYDYYLEKSKVGSEREALVAHLDNHQPKAAISNFLTKQTLSATLRLKEIRTQRRSKSEAHQTETRAKQTQWDYLTKLENEILRLETLQKELATQLEDPALYLDTFRALEVNRQLTGVAKALEVANSAWTEIVKQFTG